jgi:hypothetical protein
MEEKGIMKVTEFVEGYNKVVSDKLKGKYIEDTLTIKSYIPFTDKVNIANRIAKTTTHEYDKNGKEIGIKVNSTARYLLFTLNIIDLFTNIDIDFSNTTKEYELLDENNLISQIIELLPADQIKEFQTLLNMAVDDILENELSTHSFISSQVTRFSSLISAVLQPTLETLGKNIAELDDETIDKLKNAVNGGLKVVK